MRERSLRGGGPSAAIGRALEQAHSRSCLVGASGVLLVDSAWLDQELIREAVTRAASGAGLEFLDCGNLAPSEYPICLSQRLRELRFAASDADELASRRKEDVSSKNVPLLAYLSEADRLSQAEAERVGALIRGAVQSDLSVVMVAVSRGVPVQLIRVWEMLRVERTLCPLHPDAGGFTWEMLELQDRCGDLTVGEPEDSATAIRSSLIHLFDETPLLAAILSLGKGLRMDVIADALRASDLLDSSTPSELQEVLQSSASEDGSLRFSRETEQKFLARADEEQIQSAHALLADALGKRNQDSVWDRSRLVWHAHLARKDAHSAADCVAIAKELAAIGWSEEGLRFALLLDPLLKQIPKGIDKCRLLSDLVDALWELGQSESVVSAAQLALEDCEYAGEVAGEVKMHVLWQFGRALVRSGDPKASRRAFKQLRKEAVARRLNSWVAQADLGLASVCQMTGSFDRISELADSALCIAERREDERIKATACNVKGNALVALCRWKEAKAWYRRSRDFAEKIDDPALVQSATANLGVANFNLGEWSEAEEKWHEAHALAERMGSPYAIALTRSNQGLLLLRRGVLDQAESVFRQAIRRAADCGEQWLLSHIYSNLGESASTRGDTASALGLYNRAQSIMMDHGLFDDLPELRRRRGEALLAIGALTDAEHELDESSELAEAAGNRLEIASSLLARAELFEALEKQEAARGLGEKCVHEFAQMSAKYELACAHRLLGALDNCRSRSDAEDAHHHLLEAKRIFSQLGASRDLALVSRVLIGRNHGDPDGGKLPRTSDRLAALVQLAGVIAVCADQDQLCEELSAGIAGALGADSCGVLIRGAETQATAFARTQRACDAAAEAEIMEDILGSCRVRGETLLLSGLELSSEAKQAAERAGIQSILLASIGSDGECEGAVYADRREPGPGFTREDQQFLSVLANHASSGLENLRLREKMRREISSLRWEVDCQHTFADIIGRSLSMQRLFSLLQRVSKSSVTVLIEGESGTGKELVARAIHAGGARSEGRFVAQNCAALPEQLLESELFGHVRGAFTGAHRDKKGLFEVADKGTFLLDEIADMPPMLQVKLLRVLQEGEIRRVGGTEPIPVDVRIIAATNKPLQVEVQEGRFRRDLFYRLNVVRLEMPPLRERRDDIPLLAQHFLDEYSAEHDKAMDGFTEGAMELLVNYDWPGNVRELENEIQRAVALADRDSTVTSGLLSDRIRSVEIAIHPPKPGHDASLKDLVEDVERRVILQVLADSGWNKSRTARTLGLSRQGLLKKIARYGLSPEQEE